MNDIREMRKRILACGWRGERFDGEDTKYRINTTQVLVRAVLSWQERDGLSAEDAMTCLAYQALLQLEKAYDQQLHMANISVKPSMLLGNYGIIDAPDPKGAQT